MRSAFIVVGDRFESFGSTEGVVTFSSLLDQLETRSGLGDIGDVAFVEGQGLQIGQVGRLLKAAKRVGKGHCFPGWDDGDRRAPRRLTHKHRKENVLISDPVQIEDNVYSSVLLIDERNEFLSDHITGKHLPGMIIIEAVRQLAMAVTEKYFVESDASFCMSTFDNRFLSFAFPIATTLRHTISDKRSEKGTTTFTTVTETIQCGGCVAEGSAKFSIFQRAVLEHVETKLMTRALSAMP